MNLRELLTGGPPQTLGLDAKGFAYSQQGGNSSSSGRYYTLDGSGFGSWRGLTSPTSSDYAGVELEMSSALAVVVNTVVRAFPEAELCVERELDDDEDERLGEHPALLLMERPNPYLASTQIAAQLIRDYMVTGNAYLVKRRGQGGMPVELWPIDAGCMRPVWPTSGDEFISGYELTIDGNPKKFKSSDVLHFRNGLDMAAPSYGRCGASPLTPMMRDLYIDGAAADFTSAIMKNMGMPGAIISPKALVDGRAVTLPPEVRDQFAADYQARFTGGGRGRALIMGNPIDVQQVGFDPSKMALVEIRRIVEERLSAIYNIPAIIAGFGAGLDRATYANYEEATKAFWNGCIIPMQREFAEVLTTQLLRPDYGADRLYFEYEHDHIKALQESETEKRERDRADYLAGGLTHHQYVSRLGIEPKGEDWQVMPSTVTAYPINLIPEAPEPEPAPPQLALPPAPDDTSKAQTKADDPDRGSALDRSDTEIEDESQITDEDIADASEWVRENVPELADLLDATAKAAMLETKATYRWNPRTRRYIGADGRMVPKAAVDAAMDAAVDVGRAEMAGYADALIAGDMSLPAYQVAMEASIKRMHLAGIATTRGGWANLTPRERGQAAQRIQEQYKYLNKSCLDFESGARPVDGRMRASSMMYASSSRAAYGEADYDAAKDAVEADPATHQERWIRHASDSCNGCVHQASREWVKLGELPPIGESDVQDEL